MLGGAAPSLRRTARGALSALYSTAGGALPCLPKACPLPSLPHDRGGGSEAECRGVGGGQGSQD